MHLGNKNLYHTFLLSSFSFVIFIFNWEQLSPFLFYINIHTVFTQFIHKTSLSQFTHKTSLSHDVCWIKLFFKQILIQLYSINHLYFSGQPPAHLAILVRCFSCFFSFCFSFALCPSHE